VGNLRDRLAGRDIHDTLRQRLAELEHSNHQAIIASAELIRFTTAAYMTHDMLPAGKKVQYLTMEDGDIPTIPVNDGLEPESAITAETDAISEGEIKEAGRGDLQVPYVPAARRFYLPQWVCLR